MARAALNTYFEMEQFGEALLQHIKCFSEIKHSGMTEVVDYVKDYVEVLHTGKNYFIVKNNKESIESEVVELLKTYFGKDLFIRTKFDSDNNLLVRI